jgi:hypothetical protein
MRCNTYSGKLWNMHYQEKVLNQVQIPNPDLSFHRQIVTRHC